MDGRCIESWVTSCGCNKRDGFDKSRIVVHLSSCLTKDNYHAPPCLYVDYLKALISKLGLDMVEDIWISKTADKRWHASLCITDKNLSQGTDDHV